MAKAASGAKPALAQTRYLGMFVLVNLFLIPNSVLQTFRVTYPRALQPTLTSRKKEKNNHNAPYGWDGREFRYAA
jgi:hypothetical protein